MVVIKVLRIVHQFEIFVNVELCIQHWVLRKCSGTNKLRLIAKPDIGSGRTLQL